MNTIHKHVLNQHINSIKTHAGSKVLSVHQQKQTDICLWVLVDESKPAIVRKFSIFPTGDPVSCDEGEELKFVGTVHVDNGFFVLHVFENVEVELYAKIPFAG